ncbi:MAG: ATP-binding protein [Chloroflexota bacterium]|nr:ATP-binding protein [Chloroflexota bacterium]
MVHRIHRRITLPYLIVLVVVFIFSAIFVVNHIQRYEEARWQTQLLYTANLISTQAQPLFGLQGEDLHLSDLAQTSSEALNLTVTILSPNGELLGTSLPIDQQPGDPFTLPAVPQAIAEGQATQLTEGTISAAVKILGTNSELLGVVHLQAPHTYYQMDLNPISWLVPAAILISALTIAIIILIVHNRSQVPFEKLTIAAQQISLGNFHNLEFPGNAYPLTMLSQAMQKMAARVGEQIDTLTSERTQLSAVLNQMTDGVLIADPEGRVQLLNPAAERLFQVNEKSRLNRSIVEVLRYHQLVDIWHKARDGDRQSTMLEIGPQHLFLQVVAMPLKISLPGSTLLLFQDLTQLRRLETVRRDFISNVSHELRTPLASMKALAETLQEGALEDPPAARRFLLRMETEIDNLTQLVNELLELSRIESGKVPLSFHRIQPCELLKPAVERMSLQAERAGLVLTLECPSELPVVFADPDRISQVMINLIHNAIKFTPPGGKITVSAYQDVNFIVFFVRDSGVGIARKDLGRIFERFYKADRARAGGGTGLGLSIARHMIESHGGYIWAESEDGVGSTFYFSLPTA